MKNRTEAAPEQRVESVERALAILDALADGPSRMSLAQVSRATGLYRSTILRLASSLERFGYLRRDHQGHFQLGPTLLRLGTLYQSNFELADHVRPVLDRIATETGETAAFYIREQDRRICLYRQSGSQVLRSHLDEGAILPIDRGASARILVAYTDGTGPFYEEIRAKASYVSLGERDPETAAAAVPVFGSGHRFLGALGITGARGRFDDASNAEFVAILSAHAAELSRTLGDRS